MKIGRRNVNLGFIFDYRHYVSLLNIFKYCKQPVSFFRRYFLGKGDYPCQVVIKTPIGPISPTIYFYDDSLTINEIFFRLDYEVGNRIKVFVDVGANIGISALYFLTRNSFSKGYLYEPVPSNLYKLSDNLKAFIDRVHVEPAAVYIDNETRQFGIEDTGRLGGINRTYEQKIEVKCISVNDMLENILQKEGFIDVLKVDIEGDEVIVVQAIDHKYLDRIGLICFDIDCTLKLDENFSLFPDYFNEHRYGNTYVMVNKNYDAKQGFKKA
ncbi:MAG: FkbM family methyltransferase [Candidatus Falkowbacteria bacterium]